MGLFNIKLQDPEFYAAAQEDSVIIIDKDSKTIQIEGNPKVFEYDQSDIEQTLLDSGGVLPLYGQFGRRVFRHITAPKVTGSRKRNEIDPVDTAVFTENPGKEGLEW